MYVKQFPLITRMRQAGGRRAAASLFGVGVAFTMAPAAAGDLEVLHYFSYGDSARALYVARDDMRARGHAWHDFATAYGTSAAISTLVERIRAGAPPTAAQVVNTHAVQRWSRDGVLANLDGVARAEKWDDVLPAAVRGLMKFNRSYVAVPISVSRNNMLWMNPDVLAKAGVRAPATWEQFFETAEAVKRAGFVPLAHGAQPWQHLLLFESILLGTAGIELFRKAMLSLDPGALASPDMVRALQAFRRLRAYTAPDAGARDWTAASDDVVRGKAAMQVIGEWAAPAFAEAERTSGIRYICAPAPGIAPAYEFNLDSFTMFRRKLSADQKAQRDLASDLMSPALQQRFNLIRGRLPARLGVDLRAYGRCARESGAAYAAAARNRTLVATPGVVVPPGVIQAWQQILSDFWESDQMTPAMASDRMLAATRQPR
jgi:glucose/mannose transport system substrate-binding protein